MGPGIIMFNHIAFIDGIAILNALKRNAVPLVKNEAGGSRSGESSPRCGARSLSGAARWTGRRSNRRSRYLDSGELLLIAPEGHRSPALIEGKEGLAYIAARTQAPIIPAVIDGSEGFPSLDPKRWRLPGARIRFGKPFRFRLPSGRIPREWLRKMTDEAMYRLASLLPPARRGVYGDLRRATTETIEFLAP